MDVLPSELIGHIVGFADLETRNAISEVSKLFKRQDRETRECMLKTRNPFELQEALRAFPRAYGVQFMVTCGNFVQLGTDVIRGLKFSFMTHIDMARVVISGNLFEILMAERGPLMKFLRLRRCTIDNAAISVRRHCHPELLSVCDLTGTSSDADSIWVSTKLKNKHLKAFDPDSREFPFARFIKLDKPGIHLDSSRALSTQLLIQKCPNLEKISLGGRLMYEATMLFLGALVRSPKLRILHLSTYALNDDVLNILVKMKYLESLHLDFKVFTADVIKSLAGFRHLKSVGLAKTPTVLDVCRLSDSVESLHLSKTTKTAAVQAIKGLPNLRSFEIGGADLGLSLFESFEKDSLERMRSVCMMGDCGSARDLVYRTVSLKMFGMKSVFIDSVWDVALSKAEVNHLMGHSGHTLEEVHLVITPEGVSALSAEVQKRKNLKIVALAVAVPEVESVPLKAAAIAGIVFDTDLMMTPDINLLDLYFLVKDDFMADELLRHFNKVAESSMVSDMHCFITSGAEDDICKFVRAEICRCGAK